MLNHESATTSRIELPPVPMELRERPVAAWSEPIWIDSYLPEEPDAYPAFLNSRVYQGSSGRVFPLPFHERISQSKVPHEWQAIHLENDWVRLVILPELGGRIHIGYDKVAEYDFFYRNNVIKPALVGLAGPWISGGVEFNWPQHHRPGTFLPTDTEIELEDDGAVTVWSSDHDPFARMKGMHGIRLRPDSSLIEARVRLYNRTDVTQSFLWWANVAAAANDDYQSFFPADVTLVADHARRAVSTFPAVEGRYYGVDYQANVDAEHPDADRLDWYRNIPVPTSYMVLSTEDEFFGGYDHGREAGFVHWAPSEVAPGKKQWTWGNSEFGWAWDANLTDSDGPYVELMAGVFTDNQPDFAWLAPGETKTFSQYWYPIQLIGPVQQATKDVAVSLHTVSEASEPTVQIGVAATRHIEGATIRLSSPDGAVLFEIGVALAPSEPFVAMVAVPTNVDLTLVVSAAGNELVRIAPREAVPETRNAATEPPAPADVASIEELVIIGRYLAQYRHATRSPEPYWDEALRREPGDSRSHLALGTRRYDDGQFEQAREHFQRAVDRETTWVPTPWSGEAHYRLALALERLGRSREAAAVFARASWDAAWRPSASFALARLAARSHDWERSEHHLAVVLEVEPDHLQAANLLTLVLRAQGRDEAAAAVLRATRERDGLDQWARDLEQDASARPLTEDATVLLDVAIEYARVGFVTDALRVLDIAEAASRRRPIGQVEVGPLIGYHRARVLAEQGRDDEARAAAVAASHTQSTYCLPSRLDDIEALTVVLARFAPDALASSLLGHWYYSRGRVADAMDLWQQALDSSPDDRVRAIVERNLGIAAYNALGDPVRARTHYAAALAAAPHDARLWYERDQLAARSGESDQGRLAILESARDVVALRDDLTVVLVNLLTSADRAPEARRILESRNFQPWEGGEGTVLDAWTRTCLALASNSLGGGDGHGAVELIREAINTPSNLGEARHPLANTARIHLALGDALASIGQDTAAMAAWRTAAEAAGDFSGMRTRDYSEQTYYSIEGLYRLGDSDEASRLTDAFEKYIDELATEPASVDYFATSLPRMLLFADDPTESRDREVAMLRDKLRRLRNAGTDERTAAQAVQTGRQ